MGAVLDALVIRGRLTTRHYGDGPWAVDVLEDDADGVNVHGHVADDGATGGEGYREGEWVGGPHPCPWIWGGRSECPTHQLKGVGTPPSAGEERRRCGGVGQYPFRYRGDSFNPPPSHPTG